MWCICWFFRCSKFSGGKVDGVDNYRGDMGPQVSVFFKAHFYDKVKKIDFGCSEISHQKLKNLNSTNDADMYFT